MLEDREQLKGQSFMHQAKPGKGRISLRYQAPNDEFASLVQ